MIEPIFAIYLVFSILDVSVFDRKKMVFCIETLTIFAFDIL